MTNTTASFISTIALLLATKQSIAENSAKQKALILAEFPEFDNLDTDYKQADYDRMNKLCGHLYPESSELHKLETETLDLAYSQICDYFLKEAPDKQLRKMMQGVIQFMDGKPYHFPKHRVVAWAINGFSGSIPSTQDAFKILEVK